MTTTVVCILGMHRSGTSMVTQLLHNAGLALGPERDLMPATPYDNQEGYWENSRFVQINDAILKFYGGTWDQPPIFPVGWASDPNLNRIRDEARELIANFDGEVLWGWKDPRTCLTLPFWQAIIPNLKHILCVREPLEVAQSLMARDGSFHGRSQALNLWTKYNRAAFDATLGGELLVTNHISYFYDPDAELKRLLAFIGTPRDQVTSNTVRPDLWRGVTLLSSNIQAGLPPETASIYVELKSKCGPIYESLIKDERFRSEMRSAALDKAMNQIARLEELCAQRAILIQELRRPIRYGLKKVARRLNFTSVSRQRLAYRAWFLASSIDLVSVLVRARWSVIVQHFVSR